MCINIAGGLKEEKPLPRGERKQGQQEFWRTVGRELFGETLSGLFRQGKGNEMCKKRVVGRCNCVELNGFS